MSVAPNLLRMVAEHAIPEAESLESQAAEWEVKGQALRREATVLRSLWELAAPHVVKRAALMREDAA